MGYPCPYFCLCALCGPYPSPPSSPSSSVNVQTGLQEETILCRASVGFRGPSG